MAALANRCSDSVIYSVCWNQQNEQLQSGEGILSPASLPHTRLLPVFNWIPVWGFQVVFIGALPTMHGSLLITYITNGDKCCIASWESSLIGGVGNGGKKERKCFFYRKSAWILKIYKWGALNCSRGNRVCLFLLFMHSVVNVCRHFIKQKCCSAAILKITH